MPSNFEKVICKNVTKSVTTPTIIITAMILMNQNSANKFWDRSPKNNFLYKNTCLILAKVKQEHHIQVPTIGHCFSADTNFANNFEKGKPRKISVKIFQNLTSSFREEFLRISSCLYGVNSPRPLEPSFLTDQNFMNNFSKKLPKGYFCEIISKSDQRFENIFQEFPHVLLVQVSPTHQYNDHSRSIILQTLFKKGHPRNISVKFFQNLTCHFKKEFLKISSCQHSASSPPIHKSHVSRDQNFTNKF